MTPVPITVSDIHTMNDEPRVLDVRLAEALGFERPRNIRNLVQRNLVELGRYGEVFSTVGQSLDEDEDFASPRSKMPRGRGRPAMDYWLNEAQALLLATLSRTERAADVRYELITAYLEKRRGAARSHLDLLPSAVVVEGLSYMERIHGQREYRMAVGNPRIMAGYRAHGLIEPKGAPRDEAEDAREVLRHLLSEHVRPEMGTVAELVERALLNDMNARNDLWTGRIRASSDMEEPGFVIAYRSPVAEAAFRGTPFAQSWRRLLLSLPGVQARNNRRWLDNLQDRGLFVPLGLLDLA